MKEEPVIDKINLPTVDFVKYIRAAYDFSVDHYPAFLHFIKSSIGFLIGISIPVSVFLFVAIIITVERLKSIRAREEEIFEATKVEMAFTEVAADPSKANPHIAYKWDKVLEHVESQNQNDWRQAIIEADIILGELLVKLGYKGEGIGEQLKRARENKGDFTTIDEAWEAHLVRNQLAHEGSDYPFSQYDAKRVISLYRKVFEEFFYI